MNLPSGMQNEAEVKKAAIHCVGGYLDYLQRLRSDNKPLTSRSLKLQATAISTLAKRLEELEG